MPPNRWLRNRHPYTRPFASPSAEPVCRLRNCSVIASYLHLLATIIMKAVGVIWIQKDHGSHTEGGKLQVGQHGVLISLLFERTDRGQGKCCFVLGRAERRLWWALPWFEFNVCSWCGDLDRLFSGVKLEITGRDCSWGGIRWGFIDNCERNLVIFPIKRSNVSVTFNGCYCSLLMEGIH